MIFSLCLYHLNPCQTRGTMYGLFFLYKYLIVWWSKDHHRAWIRSTTTLPTAPCGYYAAHHISVERDLKVRVRMMRSLLTRVVLHKKHEALVTPSRASPPGGVSEEKKMIGGQKPKKGTAPRKIALLSACSQVMQCNSIQFNHPRTRSSLLPVVGVWNAGSSERARATGR